ncbi:MAG: DUF4167 domain-containing protein [Alphaproteobacteria bacterium]|nr:DUF4167 domain-containing protein [Alphaproteobacteria bacterium]
MKRSRGRGRRPQNSANRSYDSNGPDVRVRGTASQVYEKYQNLTRDATTSGDRIMAENYQQHGEHYYRILMSQQAQMAEATSSSPSSPSSSAAPDASKIEKPAAPETKKAEASTPDEGSVRSESEEEKKPRRRGPLRTTAPVKTDVKKKPAKVEAE